MMLPVLSLLHQTHTCSDSGASPVGPVAFVLFRASAPVSGTVSPGTWGTLLLSLPSGTGARHFSSQKVSAQQHCPSPLIGLYNVCVCVCVYACVCGCILHIVMFKPLLMSTLLVFVKLLIAFSILMYIIRLMFIQHFEPQCRRFTNFHYYYYDTASKFFK